MRWLPVIFSLLFFACLNPPSLDKLRSSQELTAEANSNLQGGLKIWLPYIGQGDATLIQFSNGKNLLIDATRFEAAEEHLIPFLEQLRIERLEAVLITHYDGDHLGGMPALLAGADGIIGNEDDIEIGVVYDRGGVPWDPSPAYTDYLTALELAGVSRVALRPGEEIFLDPQVELHCLAVGAEVDFGGGKLVGLDLSPETLAGKENAASIVLLLEFGEFRYLTGGDLTGGASLNGFLTPDVESLLAQVLEPVDALHVNHHGSLSSSNENFVQATQPQAVFIQAGIDNPYGHPAFTVLNRWTSVGAKIYSTHEGEGYLLTVDSTGFEVSVIPD